MTGANRSGCGFLETSQVLPKNFPRGFRTSLRFSLGVVEALSGDTSSATWQISWQQQTLQAKKREGVTVMIMVRDVV